MSRVLPALLLVLASALGSSPVRALTVRPPSFGELVSSADSIVVGEITHVECVPHDVDERPVPFTQVTIAVSETLKGPATASIILQCLGGSIGTESLKVVGVPDLRVGERGFFFVQNNGIQFFPLVGIGHGLYRTVRSEPDGSEHVVRANGEPLRSTADVSAPLAHTATSVTSSRTAAGALTPAEFTQQIRREVARVGR